MPIIIQTLMLNIKPLGDRVLIEPISDEEKAKQSKGGILIPDTAKAKKQSSGRVVAVGSGKLNERGERIPVAVKVGDAVLFKEPWSDEDKIEDADKKYFLVEEGDILAIIL